MHSEEWSAIEKKRHLGFPLTAEESRKWSEWEKRIGRQNDVKESIRANPDKYS